MRTPDEVISHAIKENRLPEYLLYTLAVVFVITGEVLIGWSLYKGLSITAIGGVALNGLAWPAFAQTRQLREQNLMLRMLEIPLSKAKTTEEAAKMLTETFARHFKKEESQKRVGRGQAAK